MPVISISLGVDFLYEVEQAIKEKQKAFPDAKITRNMVIRHYIERGIEYSKLLERARETQGVIKIVNED